MKIKLNDITRIKLIKLINNDSNLSSLRIKLLSNNELELNEEEIKQLILLGINCND